MKLPFKGCSLKDYPSGSMTQGFAENKTLYSRWGMNGHNGLDLVAPHGTPLVAVETCRVVEVKDDPEGYGRHIRLRSNKLYDGAYREWTYGHLDSIIIPLGSTVREGQQVGTMGNTGFVISGSTPFWKVNPYAGTHLHLTLRYLRPYTRGWSYRGDNERYETEDYDNGFKGAVDPTHVFIQDYDVPEVNKKMYAQLLTIQSIINSIKARL